MELAIAQFERTQSERTKKALQRASRLVQQGHISDPELAAETGYTGEIIEQAELLATYSRAAAKQSRKKQVTHQSVTVDEMRRARFGGESLDEFLQCDIAGITITAMQGGATGKRKKYEVICEAILPPRNTAKILTLGTLWDWWRLAADPRA